MVIISKKIKSFYTPVQYLSTDLFYYPQIRNRPHKMTQRSKR